MLNWKSVSPSLVDSSLSCCLMRQNVIQARFLVHSRHLVNGRSLSGSLLAPFSPGCHDNISLPPLIIRCCIDLVTAFIYLSISLFIYWQGWCVWWGQILTARGTLIPSVLAFENKKQILELKGVSSLSERTQEQHGSEKEAQGQGTWQRLMKLTTSAIGRCFLPLASRTHFLSLSLSLSHTHTHTHTHTLSLSLFLSLKRKISPMLL